MKKVLTAAVLSLGVGGVQAAAIDIFEFSAFINADEIVGDSLVDRQLFDPLDLDPWNTFGTAGLSVGFANNLDADNLGSVTWSITNTTNSMLNNVQLYGFLDAEIDEASNTNFNENGNADSLLLGSGSGDALADSWGIGDPLFDDIFIDILDANLTGTNTVSAGNESDVSMGLGFDIGTLDVGEIFSVTFNLSETDNNGLFHFDPGSDYGYYFNGAVNSSTAVPEPATFALLGLGLLGMRAFSRNKLK